MIRVNVKTRKRGGAMVVVIDDAKRILILKRPPGINWAPDTWGLPGGAIEEGETAAQAATRESKEETDLDVINLKHITLDLAPGVYPYYTSTYRGCIRIDHEHEAWKWVTRAEIESYDLAPNLLAMYDWVLNHG